MKRVVAFFCSIFPVVDLIASYHEYEHEIIGIYCFAIQRLDEAIKMGLHSPIHYCIGDYWPSRFTEYWREYSDFYRGFKQLTYSCNKDYELRIESKKEKINYCLFKLSQDLNQESRVEYTEALQGHYRTLQDLSSQCTHIQSFLQSSWSEIHNRFGQLFAKNYLGKDYRYYAYYAYQKGLFFFKEGRNFEAFEMIEEVLKSKDREDILDANNQLAIRLDLAIGYEETGDFGKAILVLNELIQENPEFTDAYLERAASYFELGEFDLSLADYLQFKSFQNAIEQKDQDFVAIGGGILMGIRNGSLESATGFAPSLLSSLRGIGNGLWATILHPIDTPKEFVQATLEICDFLIKCPKTELAEIVVPELYDLVSRWDLLNPHERGNSIGFVLGKYGTDILLTSAVLKSVNFIQSVRKLKRVEKICNLEALAVTPESRAAMLSASTEWAQKRSQFFTNVRLEVDKQGKHIASHKNFQVGKSEWTHPDPEGKLKKLSGKGQKIMGEPGIAGYKERVDCGEVIGFFVDENTKERTTTTMAVIHYSNKGAHIVPARPK